MITDKITLAHGAGGYETFKIIEELIAKVFKKKKVWGGIGLEELDDAATIPIGEDKSIAITVDSYTVKPLFFSGGNIGKLAATGTINDLAVIGAEPIAFMDSIVVEEGFPVDDLREIIESYEKVLREYDIALIGGDFKVMPKNQVDGIVISSTGIGLLEGKPLLDSNAEPGNHIVVTGPIGDHGAAIIAAQLGINDIEIKSDCRPILPAIRVAKRVGGLKVAKDPTRGGLSMALNEIAAKSNVNITVYEEKIPVRDETRALAEMTGIDVYSLASEGQAIIIVDEEHSSELVKTLRAKGFPEAEIIGRVTEKSREPRVFLKTVVGGTRLLEVPRGELVPRIC